MTAPDPVAPVAMTVEHTPGPWAAQTLEQKHEFYQSFGANQPSDWAEITSGGGVIASAYMKSEQENHANARLIASSPTLLDVVESAPIASKYHGARGFEADRFLSDYEAWRVKARAALAAARGAQVVA